MFEPSDALITISILTLTATIFVMFMAKIQQRRNMVIAMFRRALDSDEGLDRADWAALTACGQVITPDSHGEGRDMKILTFYRIKYDAAGVAHIDYQGSIFFEDWSQICREYWRRKALEYSDPDNPTSQSEPATS